MYILMSRCICVLRYVYTTFDFCSICVWFASVCINIRQMGCICTYVYVYMYMYIQ